jgi:hypothetical protein
VAHLTNLCDEARNTGTIKTKAADINESYRRKI